LRVTPVQDAICENLQQLGIFAHRARFFSHEHDVVVSAGTARKARAGKLVLPISSAYLAASLTIDRCTPPANWISSGEPARDRSRNTGHKHRENTIEHLANIGASAYLIRKISSAIPIAFTLAFVAKRGFGFWHVIEAIVPVTVGFPD
jgi:hypothetical protein